MILEKKSVGKLEYYGANGKLRESIIYDDVEKMKSDLKDDLYYGRPVHVTIYKREGEPIAITPSWFAAHCESIFAKYRIVMSEKIKGERGER